VRKGRRAEFQAFGWDPEDVPDPQDVATFERSKLDWTQASGPLLEWHRSLLALRRSEPALRDGTFASVVADDLARTIVVSRGPVAVAANLAPEPRPVDVAGEVLLASAPFGGGVLAPESAVVLRR
jgi:maltooligosyltrehalose trehalohydrolase